MGYDIEVQVKSENEESTSVKTTVLVVEEGDEKVDIDLVDDVDQKVENRFVVEDKGKVDRNGVGTPF